MSELTQILNDIYDEYDIVTIEDYASAASIVINEVVTMKVKNYKTNPSHGELGAGIGTSIGNVAKKAGSKISGLFKPKRP